MIRTLLAFSVSLAIAAPAAAQQPPAFTEIRHKALVKALFDSFTHDVEVGHDFTAEAWASDDWTDTPNGLRRRFLEWTRACTHDIKAAVDLKQDGADLSPLKGLVDEVLAESKSNQALYATEAACRRSQPCLTGRWAVTARAQLCVDLASRASAMRDIAAEKANPTGVVDLSRLHSLGQFVQDVDARIASTRQVYLREMHVRPPPCPPPSPSP